MNSTDSDTSAPTWTGGRLVAGISTDLDLVGGYISHVTRCNRSTGAYTLANRARINWYVRTAHLNATQAERLRALVATLATSKLS